MKGFPNTEGVRKGSREKEKNGSRRGKGRNRPTRVSIRHSQLLRQKDRSDGQHGEVRHTIDEVDELDTPEFLARFSQNTEVLKVLNEGMKWGNGSRLVTFHKLKKFSHNNGNNGFMKNVLSSNQSTQSRPISIHWLW